MSSNPSNSGKPRSRVRPWGVPPPRTTEVRSTRNLSPNYQEGMSWGQAFTAFHTARPEIRSESGKRVRSDGPSYQITTDLDDDGQYWRRQELNDIEENKANRSYDSDQRLIQYQNQLLQEAELARQQAELARQQAAEHEAALALLALHPGQPMLHDGGLPRRQLHPLPPIPPPVAAAYLPPNWYNNQFIHHSLDSYIRYYQQKLNRLPTSADTQYIFEPERNFGLSAQQQKDMFNNQFYYKLYTQPQRFSTPEPVEIGPWKRCFSLYLMKYYWYNVETGISQFDSVPLTGHTVRKANLYRLEGNDILVWDWEESENRMVHRNISMLDHWKRKYLRGI